MNDPPPSADLDTSLLRSLLVLAEERHFGRAADRLHLSQPALSKRVRRLEELVGGRLLVRRYRDVRLTEPGRVLLERAQALLRDAEQAIEASRDALRGETGLLRVGFGVATMARFLPEVLRRFRRSRPRVRIEMRDMSSLGQGEALGRGEIDLGFIRRSATAAGIDYLPLLQERLAAAVGRRSGWRSGDGLRSLAQDPFVVCSRSISASYYDHVVALCRAAGFAPRIVTETNELFSVLQLVRAGIGVALVPSAAAVMRVPGVRFEKVRLHEAAWEIGLIRRRTADRSPLIDEFVRVAREVAAEPA